MLPDIPGLGVWRLDSHGWNAATELPVTLEVLSQAAQANRFIPAVLRMQNRTRKTEGQTRRFVVPVIDLKDLTVRQLASGEVPDAINPPAMATIPKPALPAGAPLPDDPSFKHETGGMPEMGPAPTVPTPGGSKKRKDSGAGPGPTPPTAAAEQGEEMTAAPAPETTESTAELTAQLLAVKPDAEGAVEANKIAHQKHPERHRQWLLRQLERAKEGATA